MSDTETKTVRATPLRDFTDAGSERRFTKGVEVDVTEGELANYAAAGLAKEAVLDLSSDHTVD